MGKILGNSWRGPREEKEEEEVKEDEVEEEEEKEEKEEAFRTQFLNLKFLYP